MKRLVSLLLASLFLLAGCAGSAARRTPFAVTESAAPTRELPPTPLFTDGGTHSRTEDYNQVFTFLTASDDAFTLNIESKLFDEPGAEKLWETVTGDLKFIADAAPIGPTPPAVYIVQKPLHGNAERIGDRVYCTAEDVESGVYREALVCAALNLDGSAEWWKLKGLIAYAFGETADETVLQKYYKQTGDMDILSLFPAYFVSAFASEEELRIARETALSLTAYIVENYGAEAFLAAGDGDYRQEWLASLGVDREYADPWAGSFAGYRYASSKDYPLIVTTDRQDMFYMLPLPEDVDTPKKIRDFLYLGMEGMREIFAGVEKNAPDYYKTLLENYSQPIRYYFKSGGGRSNTVVHLREVYLTWGHAFLHETMHILVPLTPLNAQYIDDPWRYEAIANYLPFTFATSALHRDGDITLYNVYEWLFGEPEDLGDYRAFLASAGEIYRKYAGQPDKPEEVDVAVYYKSMVEARLRYPEVKSALLPIPGSELSYEEAYAFADYLIGKYSLSAFLQYCLEPDTATFPESFGITFEKAWAAWKKELLA
ncbi:MAG: hypothetical protein ABFC62_03175 [Clostridiaceae bacterium]